MNLNGHTRCDVRAFGERVVLTTKWRAGSYHLRGQAGPIAIEVHDFRGTASPILKGWWAVFLVPELPPLGRMGRDPLTAVRKGARFVESVVFDTEKRLRLAGERIIKTVGEQPEIGTYDTVAMHTAIMRVQSYIQSPKADA